MTARNFHRGGDSGDFASKLEDRADDNDAADSKGWVEVRSCGSRRHGLAGMVTEADMFALRSRPLARTVLCVAGMVAAVCSGCQVDVGGQTLPSPYYLTDDIQYFPAGPRMKVSREAAAMKAFKEEETLRASRPPQP